jgi:hypothetical protein
MVLDPSTREQRYVEDCEVCCRPITVVYSAEDGEITSFDALSDDE